MTLSMLGNMIELVPDAMLVVDAGGAILQTNDQAVELSGYTLAELLAINVDQLVPGHARGCHSSDRAGFMARPHVRPMGLLGNLSLQRKDGREVPVDVRLGYVEADGGTRVIVAVRDITQAREAERRLRESEQRFRSLAALSSDWYWEQDENLRFTFISSEQNLGGNTGSSLMGKTRFDQPNVYESEAARRQHEEDLAARRPFRELLLKRTTPDNKEWWAWISGEPVFDDDGRFRGYRGVGRDITARVRAERQIADSKKFLDGILNAIPGPIAVKDESHRFIVLNDAAVRFLGRPRETMIGRTDYDIFLPEQAAFLQGTDDIALSSQEPVEYERIYAVKGGDRRMFARKSALAVDGQTRGVVMVLTDVTERKAVEESLRESEARFRALTDLSADWYWEQDSQFRFVRFSETAPDKVVVPHDEMIGKTRFELPLEFESGQAREDHLQTLLAHLPFRDLLLRSKVTGRWVSASGEPVLDADGLFAGYRGVASDVTERRQVQERNEFLATRDTLTGLPNRALLNDRLQMAINNAARGGGRIAVLFIDLDRFKYINDTAGHDMGDRVLREVGERLGTIIRKADTLARIGGDEFVMVLEAIKEAADAEPVASRIVNLLSDPIVFEDHRFTIGASVGVAIFPNDGNDASTIMRHADMAMYQAKSEGRSCYRFFSEEINARVNMRVGLERELRDALDNDELSLYFQPQFSVSSGALVGAEALLRWNHRQRGVVSPAEFIPVAEESGLIVPIGEQVLRNAGRIIRGWRERGIAVPRIAVNISAKQLAGGEALLDQLEKVVLHNRIEASLLEFEITESLLVAEEERGNTNVLREIAGRGVRIAIDDFGTGYSSLGYLRYLPIHAIKIDRSFIAGIDGSADAAAIVRAILAMAGSLGLSVTAEGVETVEQLDLLRAMGCDTFQGYLRSKPLPEEEFRMRFLAGQPVAAGPA